MALDPDPFVPDYEFQMRAQQWREDPYYVASSATVYPVTVVSPDKAAAIKAAVAVLGPSARGYYWRFWFDGIRDVRLVPPAPPEEPGS